MQSIPISSCQDGFIEDIPISKISKLKVKGNELQLRKFGYADTHIMELVDSIKKYGLLVPIIVRYIDSDIFEVISGNRRLRAVKLLGIRKILCHIVNADDQRAIEFFLIDNIHNKKINPLDEAVLFKKYVSEFGWGGITDLSKRISKSISYIDRRMKLLELEDSFKSYIAEGKISPSVAEELVSVKDPNTRSELEDLIKNRLPSLRECRNIVKQKKLEDTEFENRNLYVESFISTKIMDVNKRTRAFDQAIMAIRLSMDKLSSIINNNEDDRMLYEIMLHHRRNLHEQIDLLYKEKKKIKI